MFAPDYVPLLTEVVPLEHFATSDRRVLTGHRNLISDITDDELLSSLWHVRQHQSGSPTPIPTFPFVGSCKYLGIYLDSKLNWLLQMKHLTARVHAAISVLKAVRHTRWGSDPKMLLLIYTSFIHPCIDDGSLFMRRARLHLSATLQRLQNICLCRYLVAMHVEANIILYSLHQDYIPTKYWIKSKSYRMHVCNRLLDSLALHPIEHIVQHATDLPLC
ncbi:hypothetical protein PR048_007961 [Dryococelus australis]|uniref:Uncharacterized protein n=1 Tax=Dryococelus australis TaxID=614101 RepID=A0ABQ9HWK3_9NEOP|nr:hypothetical protein PR048_007961 [Dryococelus australis]